MNTQINRPFGFAPKTFKRIYDFISIYTVYSQIQKEDLYYDRLSPSFQDAVSQFTQRRIYNDWYYFKII